MNGGQIRECTAYAEKNGFTVVKHYIDRAVSAKTDNRPQFQQMIKDSERGIFDVIIVWKLDRFGKKREGWTVPALLWVTIAPSQRQYPHGYRQPAARSPAGKRPVPD